ncbi:asparagine synthase (glutamine-hydrolyzing) [Pedobacter chinensis]|uniref:asparagine synthase (glutamine-hydrolyzing) n=1 Tax=Pedobacter chinensis TaxID=2282421 RepID=A0A369PVE5_9SPHI|nr:asparagine synthase (glutamine-hydrolyzing) [Pedobacter chinensis]RDC56230.1 asparagine synthase (glutamine-hydrolyzing) [Pedobacter chinensis]
MCRIAGIIDKSQNSAVLQNEVQAMCDLMAHGGPDGEGFYIDIENGIAFGHRRLALIDLSPTGHQPMFYHENKLVITFNGEIYNFQELKAELLASGHHFQTNSDTEIILACYHAYGTAGFSKLNGMFAFALHDKDKQLTYLVRDQAGIKPLYYAADDNKLTFSSEIRAFKGTAYHFNEDPDWKIYFLAFGHIPEPYTTLEAVKMLPKAHYLQWNHATNLFEIKNFTAEVNSMEINDQQRAVNHIQKTLRSATKRHLIADAPIGLFLSGGIDSSILCLLSQECLSEKNEQSQLNTLSINFDEEKFSEKSFQDLISAKINGKHAEYKIDKEIFNANFPKALHSMDQPSADGINSWFINYFAKENNLKAVLSGIGADELFGGYPSFKRMAMVKKLSKLPGFVLRTGIKFNKPALKRSYYLSYKNTVGKYLFLRGIFTPDEIAALLECSISKVDEVLTTAQINNIPNDLNPEEQASWLEYNLYMQNQLLKDTDNMSMQHGIEVRVPFLDQEFVQAVKNIAPGIKFEKSLPKSLLIKAFINILPKEIWDRHKMGFIFPFQHWLKENESFLKGLEQNDYSRQLVRSFKKGDLHWSKILALHQIWGKG